MDIDGNNYYWGGGGGGMGYIGDHAGLGGIGGGGGGAQPGGGGGQVGIALQSNGAQTRQSFLRSYNFATPNANKFSNPQDNKKKITKTTKKKKKQLLKLLQIT